MIVEYLNKLKNDKNLSLSEISKMSGVPEQTVRRILSGATTNPGIDTVVSLVISMGGNLNDIVEPQKEGEIEMNAINVLKELFTQYQISKDTEIKDLKKSRNILFFCFVGMVAAITFLLIFDLMNGGLGYVRY